MLTAKKVERAKQPGCYHCGLIRGLYLQVTASGAKSWVLRYQLRGQERWMGLGSAADFSLREARASVLERLGNFSPIVLIPWPASGPPKRPPSSPRRAS